MDLEFEVTTAKEYRRKKLKGKGKRGIDHRRKQMEVEKKVEEMVADPYNEATPLIGSSRIR